MKQYDDISDNEVRVIGPLNPNEDKDGNNNKKWYYIVGVLLVVILVVVLIRFFANSGDDIVKVGTDSVYVDVETEDMSLSGEWLKNNEEGVTSATYVRDSVVEGIRLRLLTPCNAQPELLVGDIDTNDASIVFAALAADIRRDNGKIVGAFVLRGEPLAWGLSKKGYCAIINGFMAIGVASNSPLFERATEEGGYFFRHYPAVNHGKAESNKPENKSFRRCLCSLEGKITIVQSLDRVEMNDFSQLLVRLGVDEAIYLVGGYAHGWYVDEGGARHNLGTEKISQNPSVNYLVFRK